MDKNSNNNNNNNKKKTQQTLGKEENLDFQSCHIIRFKCPVFNNNKNHKTYKETWKYDPLKRKK